MADEISMIGCEVVKTSARSRYFPLAFPSFTRPTQELYAALLHADVARSFARYSIDAGSWMVPNPRPKTREDCRNSQRSVTGKCWEGTEGEATE